MANQSLEVVVLKDLKGQYYVLPREGLEQARVPEEYRADLEKLIQEGQQEELSDEQLEAVSGGVTSFGTFRVSSKLSTQMSHWSVAQF